MQAHPLLGLEAQRRQEIPHLLLQTILKPPESGREMGGVRIRVVRTKIVSLLKALRVVLTMRTSIVSATL
jgi:hypothetical protein